MKQYLSRLKILFKEDFKDIKNEYPQAPSLIQLVFKKGKVLKLTNTIFIFNFSLWTFNRSRKDAFCPCSIFICISEQNKLFSICGKPSGSWACSNQKIDYKLQNNEKYIFCRVYFQEKNRSSEYGKPGSKVNAFWAWESGLHN